MHIHEISTRRICSIVLLAALAAFAAFAVVLAAGCGSSGGAALNVVPAEHAIASSIQSQYGVHTAVVCPSNVPKKAGQAFTCTAHLAVGAYPVTVVETNGSGHVRYTSSQRPVALDITKVQHAIAVSIAQQRHLSATVTCPATVLQQSGLTFTCTAVVNGKPYPFEVTETDSHGHVRYVGR